MSTHAFLPPSGAKAWRLCAKWPKMNATFPTDDSPESLEGNAAHWVAWEMLAGRAVSENDLADNGHIVTGEMIDGGDLMVDTINTRAPLATFPHRSVEKWLDCSNINDLCDGTPDFWALDQTNNTIELIDYKFGHRFVDERENDQCIAYAAGIIKLMGQFITPNTTFNITIVQPRCFYRGSPVRTWTIKRWQLEPLIQRLRDAAALTEGLAVTATTNSECRNCPGRHACSTLQEAAYSDAQYASISSIVELDTGPASLELRMLDLALQRLQARRDGLYEYVIAKAKAGQPIPHHTLEATPGKTVWAQPVDAVIALGTTLGKDLRGKISAITPSQARKLGIDEAVIMAYSSKTSGKINLVPFDSKDASRVFTPEQ